MDVIDINGKKLGFINDLLLNFSKRKVVGFNIRSTSLIKKDTNVLSEDVISFNSVMVTIKTVNGNFLKFKDVKGIDVKDKKGGIVGMLEDILFDERDFSISSAVVSTGFITNFIYGKKIILLNELILGEKSLFYNIRNENLSFSSIPHKLFIEDDLNEKSE
jgi:uncharacterized protein YrrD